MSDEQKVEMPDPAILLEKVIEMAKKYPEKTALGHYVRDGRPECIIGYALSEGLNWPIQKIELLGTKTIDGLYESAYIQKNEDDYKCVETMSHIQTTQDCGRPWKQSYLEGMEYLEWLEEKGYGDN